METPSNLRIALDTEREKLVKRFAFLDHTADIGLRVYGVSLPKLFENAAHGMYSQLNAPVENEISFRKTITVEGADNESLLVQWLNELIYYSFSERVIMTAYEIKKLSAGKLVAEAWGRKLLRGETFPIEIKAVTYHDIKIRQTKTGYTTKIIFDV